MRLMRIMVLCLIVGQGLILVCRGQNEPTSVEYYWVSADEVLLWRSPDSEEIISGLLDQNTGEWTVLKDPGNNDWRQILEKVAQQHDPKVDLSVVDTKLLWSFALTTLRNESTAAKWARLRRPSTEIYFQLTTNDEADVAFISPPTSRVLVKFALRQDTWVTTSDLVPQKLLGLANNSSELSKVFPIPASLQPPFDENELGLIWDHWIKDLAGQLEGRRHVMYRNSDNELRWCWIERLKREEVLPAVARKMPTALGTLKVPELPQVNQDNPSSVWLIVELFLGLMLIGGVVVIGIVYRDKVVEKFKRIFRSSNEAKAADPEVPPPSVENVLLGVKTLDLIHQTAVERSGAAKDTAEGKALLAAMEWVRSEYMAAAISVNLIEEESAQRTRALDAYFKDELGLASTEPAAVKKWLQVGQVTESAIAELIEFGVPAEVSKQLPKKWVSSKGGSEEDWLADWPEVIKAFNACLNTRRAEGDAHEKKVKELSASYAAEKRALEGDFNVKLRDKDSSIKAAQDLLVPESKARKAAEQEAVTLERKIAELNKQITELNKQITEISEKDKSTRQRLETILRRKQAVENVKNLSTHLRDWLQKYYSARKNDPENRGAAVLAALINYSLYQMCFSVITEGESALRNISAHNILLMIRTYQGHLGPGTNSRETFDLLNQIAPEAELNVREMANSASSTHDEQFFKGLLRWLKLETDKELSRLYIDLDEEGKPRYVSIS